MAPLYCPPDNGSRRSWQNCLLLFLPFLCPSLLPLHLLVVAHDQLTLESFRPLLLDLPSAPRLSVTLWNMCDRRLKLQEFPSVSKAINQIRYLHPNGNGREKQQNGGAYAKAYFRVIIGDARKHSASVDCNFTVVDLKVEAPRFLKPVPLTAEELKPHRILSLQLFAAAKPRVLKGGPSTGLFSTTVCTTSVAWKVRRSAETTSTVPILLFGRQGKAGSPIRCMLILE